MISLRQTISPEQYDKIKTNKSSVICVLETNDHFGELGIITGKKRKFTAKTQTPCVLLKLSIKDFKKLVYRFDKINKYFKRYLDFLK